MKNWSKLLFTLFLCSLTTCKLLAQSTPEDQKMQWFKDAKLGIFIHWGIYSVNGIDESWSFFNDYISYDDYMKQLDGFTAAKYDPEKNGPSSLNPQVQNMPSSPPNTMMELPFGTARQAI